MTVFRFEGDQPRLFAGYCYVDTGTGVHLHPGDLVVSDEPLEAQWFTPLDDEPAMGVRAVRSAARPAVAEIPDEEPGEELSEDPPEDIAEAPAEPTEIEGD